MTFKNAAGFRKVVVNGFFEGSIMVDSSIIFDKNSSITAKQIKDDILDANKTDSLGFPITDVTVTEKGAKDDDGLADWLIGLIVALSVVFLIILIVAIVVSQFFCLSNIVDIFN